MRVPLHTCYILHTKKYLESSLLLQVFSRDYGRVPLVAKGAKRKHNKQRYWFRPCQRLLLAWSGKGGMGTLTGIEPEPPIVQFHPEAMFYGFYVNEITSRLLHQHEPHTLLFDAYDRFFLHLAEMKDINKYKFIWLYYFEKCLLQTLGYSPILDRDITSGKALVSNKQYYYQLERGPSLHRLDENHVLVSGRALLALHNECINPDDSVVCSELRRLLRILLASHLGPKPLVSRKLYTDYADLQMKDKSR